MSNLVKLTALKNYQINYLVAQAMGLGFRPSKIPYILNQDKQELSLTSFMPCDTPKFQSINQKGTAWFAPTEDWEHCGKLLDAHDYSIIKQGNKYLVSYYSSQGIHFAINSDLKRAICIARLQAFFGNEVDLKIRKQEDE